MSNGIVHGPVLAQPLRPHANTSGPARVDRRCAMDKTAPGLQSLPRPAGEWGGRREPRPGGTTRGG